MSDSPGKASPVAIHPTHPSAYTTPAVPLSPPASTSRPAAGDERSTPIGIAHLPDRSSSTAAAEQRSERSAALDPQPATEPTPALSPPLPSRTGRFSPRE